MKLLRNILGIIITYNLLHLTIPNHCIIIIDKSNIVFLSTLYVAYNLYSEQNF